MSKLEHALKTVRDIISHAKEKGDVLAPKELKEKRVNICQSCNFYKNGLCSVCGCIMKVKAGLIASTCPKGRWEEKIIQEAFFGRPTEGFEDERCCT